MREALSDIVGAPVPEWSWQKAFLPCSMGGLGLRRPSFHAPAAYTGSLQLCLPLMSRILGHSPSDHPFLSICLLSLSAAADRPEWMSIQSIDVPLHQRSLSKSIDRASYDVLADMAPDTRSKALALSSSTPHACDWLQVVPSRSLGLHFQDREFRVCLHYWLGLSILTISLTVPSATLLQTSLVTITLDAVVMGTEFFAITLSEMQSSPQPNQLL